MRRGYGVRMKRRLRIFALAAVCAGVVVLSGCAPGEEPTPPPTAAFASDEEAFAAAEETYRAYVDALNEARDGSDVDPLAFLVGDALTAGIDGEKLIEDRGVSIAGRTDVISFIGTTFDSQVISSLACIDVSDTRVTASDGSDQTPTTRAEQITFEIEILSVDGLLKIRSSEVVKDSC